MIRRRPQLDPLSPTNRQSSTYDKAAKGSSGIPFLRISLRITAIIFMLLLLVVANFLDSIHSAEPHFEPNNFVPRNVTIANNGNENIHTSQFGTRNKKDTTNIGSPSISRDVPPLLRAAAINNSTSGGSKSNSEIPYIRYEPLNFDVIKERYDYASSHGDAENPNNPNNTIGQHLLDFGIIGFPKCGTTTMMRWLNKHDEIAVVHKEIMSLQKQHPARILKFVTLHLPEGRYRRGYKSPNDVEDGRARNKLRVHYPETRLLVGLRHPVLWFESFYNHRVQNGRPMPNLVEEIKNRSDSSAQSICSSIWQGACFPRSHFHTSLARWGKTPLLSADDDNKEYESYHGAGYKRDDEWKLFSNKNRRELRHGINQTAISPNPIFLYDVGQLRMPGGSNNHETKGQQKHYEDFVLTLQDFLGVPMNVSAMPTMMWESPGNKDGINATEQARRESLKIDLCDDKHEIPRKWLIDVGANVAKWITNYFVKSPHGVFVGGGIDETDGSSRFLEILESYGKDPCPERRLKKAGR